MKGGGPGQESVQEKDFATMLHHGMKKPEKSKKKKNVMESLGKEAPVWLRGIPHSSGRKIGGNRMGFLKRLRWGPIEEQKRSFGPERPLNVEGTIAIRGEPRKFGGGAKRHREGEEVEEGISKKEKNPALGGSGQLSTPPKIHAHSREGKGILCLEIVGRF